MAGRVEERLMNWSLKMRGDDMVKSEEGEEGRVMVNEKVVVL